MQNRDELRFPVRQFARPSIGAKCATGAVPQVENRNLSAPNRAVSLSFMYWHRLNKRRLAAMLGFHGLLELVTADFNHRSCLVPQHGSVHGLEYSLWQVRFGDKSKRAGIAGLLGRGIA